MRWKFYKRSRCALIAVQNFTNGLRTDLSQFKTLHTDCKRTRRSAKRRKQTANAPSQCQRHKMDCNAFFAVANDRKTGVFTLHEGPNGYSEALSATRPRQVPVVAARRAAPIVAAGSARGNGHSKGYLALKKGIPGTRDSTQNLPPVRRVLARPFRASSFFALVSEGAALGYDGFRLSGDRR